MTAKSLRIVQNNRENKALTDVELLKHIGAEADDARIGGNVWGPAGGLYQGGYHKTSDGWISPSAWLTNHPTDAFPSQLDASSIGTAGVGLHAPQSLTAAATAGQIALSWATATEGDAADTWNLYRDAGDGNGYRLYQSGLTTTGYTDTDVTADRNQGRNQGQSPILKSRKQVTVPSFLVSPCWLYR